MIRYNPELHYDKLLNHIVEAELAGAELDMPLLPPKNNGEPNNVLFTGEETFCFPDKEPYCKLFADAWEKAEEYRKLAAKELGVSVDKIGRIFFYKKETEYPTIYDWGCKPTEDGLVFENGGNMAVMTSETYWNKEEQNK